ncbi:hypothetical protein D0469_09130 [Peribacillus saganii]|uniref:Serine protease n=1 Tax=Peribacillus saganii TaxID=2303992 RepID=A0A372LQC1_9BACI|nr:trypsin-like peptidase domain-containing protein [Peribacillus saganii]RFU69518.1 hypothetical protein D0469_09130 [Peribacillus saganii]
MKTALKFKFLVFSVAALLGLSACGTKENTEAKTEPEIIVKEVKTVQVVEKQTAVPNASVKEEKTLKDIIQFSEDKVFQVIAGPSLGSAFLYDNKGHIVTNAHVVAGYKDVEIQTVNNEILAGTVIGIGDETDVAVIHVPALEGKQPLSVSKDQAVKGEEVITFGSPNGLKDSVSTGIISGLKRDFEIPPFVYEDVYQTTAPIFPGSSGGPLIHKQTGEVIAINSASYVNQSALGFSIPVQQVIPFIDSWIQNPMVWEEVQEYDEFYNEYNMWDIPEDAYNEYGEGGEAYYEEPYSETEESYQEYYETEESYEEAVPEEDTGSFIEEEYQEEPAISYDEEPVAEEETESSNYETEEYPEENIEEGFVEETDIPAEDGTEAGYSEY